MPTGRHRNVPTMTLRTLGHKSKEFRYSGTMDDGFVIHQTGYPRVDRCFLDEALRHFARQSVYGGFSEDNPTKNGFGEWVRDESSRLNSMKLTPRHGSFMAAILCKYFGVTRSLDGNAVVLRFP